MVHKEFKRYIDNEAAADVSDSETLVEIGLLYRTAMGSEDQSVESTLPLSLLKSSCVLLSIWLGDEKDGHDDNAVEDLVRMLMRPTAAENADDLNINGLASAKIASTGKSAIPVESVSSRMRALCQADRRF